VNIRRKAITNASPSSRKPLPSPTFGVGPAHASSTSAWRGAFRHYLENPMATVKDEPLVCRGARLCALPGCRKSLSTIPLDPPSWPGKQGSPCTLGLRLSSSAISVPPQQVVGQSRFSGLHSLFWLSPDGDLYAFSSFVVPRCTVPFRHSSESWNPAGHTHVATCLDSGSSPE
jgi:hypothetical protein